ncbi:hypothetical protein CYG49_03640 [Candidatus Saccharibacteria bacterium]|nr:MAG: hypothetical protein CYG49_03640 [Candidatus Saccharibacteria bacterium]
MKKYVNQNWKYDVAIVLVYLIAAVLMMFLSRRGQEWIGLMIAALIFIPAFVIINRLRYSKDEHEKTLIQRVLS